MRDYIDGFFPAKLHILLYDVRKKLSLKTNKEARTLSTVNSRIQIVFYASDGG